MVCPDTAALSCATSWPLKANVSLWNGCPGYALELHPFEHTLRNTNCPNLCPQELWQLRDAARDALRRMRPRPMLVAHFGNKPNCSERSLRYVNSL